MSEEESIDFTSHLPDELLLTVFAHVDFKDLCRLGCVCRRLQHLTRSNVLWKRLCSVHWVDISPSEDDGSASSSTGWYRAFVECYQELGKFIGCYSTVKGHWNRIEASLKERGATAILESLNGPKTTKDDVASFTENLDIPLDLMCSYHIHNGQTRPSDQDDSTQGLGGLLSVYDYKSCPTFLSYEQILIQHYASMEVDEETTGRELNTLSIFACPFSGTTLHICLNSFGEFNRGNMFYCQHKFVCNTSFRWPAHKGFFLVAESFTDWLGQLARRLFDSGSMVKQSALFRFYREPSCIAVTRDVKVSVAATFVPELSMTSERIRRKMFAYHITMEMDTEVPMNRSCQLRTRHWDVTDGNGRVETVDGDGVVGAFPILKPGTVYSWSSCTTFDTPTGSIGGHFGMVNLQTGESFNVKCPEFHMTSLPFLHLSDDTQDDDQEGR